MNPALLDDMSWEMAEVYGAVTDQILINLSRYFPYYESGNDVPKSAFTYQAAMLAQMGQVNRETVRIIRNGLADADGALKGVLEAAIIDSVRQAEPELYDAVKKGVLALPTTPVLAPQQMRAYKLYYEQAAEKLNLVNTVMLESTQSAYQQAVSGIVSEMEVVERIGRTQTALDAAAGETISGVSAWNQAVKHATDRMKESGITGFIDHGGHHWSAEAYAAMDIRTTTFNTARAAVWETNENFGNDLYLVSSHSGARPLCYPWQNKVISSINASREVPDLDGNPVHVYAQSETSYGQPAGLFGINCGHFPNPFIPGISSADFPVQDKAENDKVYAESQEQRRLERKLREEKRDLAMAKAQGASDEEIKKLREKCRNTSQDIDDFCEQTGRTRHRDREAVYTKREFPDRKSYDVSKFETEQKERLEEYWKDGGAQQGRNFQQMTPLIPINPAPVAVPAEAATTAQVATAGVEQTAETTLHDSLADAYENHRITNGLTSVPYDPNSQLQFISEDLSRLDGKSQNAAESTISKLSKKYDTPLTSVRTMDKREAALRRNTFGYMRRSYSTETAEMVINPVKCGNYDKMVQAMKALRDSGYCAHIPDEMLDEYVFSHEFGHSLLTMRGPLKEKYNFVGADYARVEKIRKEVRSVYREYAKEIGELEKAMRDAEFRFIAELDEAAAEEARQLLQEIKAKRISEYSLTNADEFFAESFVYTEYGGTDNKYAMRVREIIDTYFRR